MINTLIVKLLLKHFLQIKIWFQNRRNKWKRQMATDCDGLALGIGPSVMQSSPFNPLPHAVAPSTAQQRRPPFTNQFSFNPTASGCRPSGQCSTIGSYALPSHRPFFPWPSSVQMSSGDFYKSTSSAFTYYPRAMAAAAAMAAAVASSEKKNSLEDVKTGGLDLSIFSKTTDPQRRSDIANSKIAESIKEEAVARLKMNEDDEKLQQVYEREQLSSREETV